MSASLAHTGSIQLTPVRVNLSQAAKVQIVTVHNTGAEETVMQVTLNKWALDGDDYTFVRSQELVITPSTFSLQPGMQQIVRIGLRGNAPENIEDSYRLVIEEVPPPAVAGESGTRMIVRHDLPVFIAPIDEVVASLDMEILCLAEGAQLNVTNIGNVHVQLRNVSLRDSAIGDSVGSWDEFEYMLPAARKSWALGSLERATSSQALGVTMLTDQGWFTADVENNCP